MDALKTQITGFDYRGPSSSEALNQMLEDIGYDLNSLFSYVHQAKSSYSSLANQMYKQEMALFRRINQDIDGTRDDGTTCIADISSPISLLYTDRDDDVIPEDQRLVHLHPYGQIRPQVEGKTRLSRVSDFANLVADGVEIALEIPGGSSETAEVFSTPLSQSITGYPGSYYERLCVSSSPLGTAPQVSFFVSVPPSYTGTGFPKSNYLGFTPFPAHTASVQVYYASSSSIPTLSIAGETWNEFPSYVTNLYDVMDECGPIYASFPDTNINALRFDLQQPYYFVQGAEYLYSYGLGSLELGLIRPTTATCIGTVVIYKPSGTFTTVATDAATVTFSNVAAADVNDVCSTYAWKIDGTTAAVEITLSPGVLPLGQVPIIKEVSVDYTGSV